MSCKHKSTKGNRRRNNIDSTTKALIKLPIQIGLLGVTVGLVNKMK